MADESEKAAASAAEQTVAVVSETVAPQPLSDEPPSDITTATEQVVKEAEKKEEEEEEKAVKKEGEEEEKEEVEEESVDNEKNIITQSVSFKEETNVVADLPEPHKKALLDLKSLLQDALNNHHLLTPPTPPPKEKEKEEQKQEEHKNKEQVEKKEEQPVLVAAEEENKKEQEEAAVTDKETKEEEEKKKEDHDDEAPPKEAVAAAETTVSVVDYDDEKGTKTVEAIQETVVSVSATDEEKPPPPPSSSSSTPPPPLEEKAEVEVEAAADPSASASESAAPPPQPEQPEEVELWGIPLLADERSDVILLKFLRARDFKVKEAFSMLKNTVRWRKEFGIDELVDEDLGSDWEKVVFTHGHDKLGHPVCYNVFGEFENKELYNKTFSDEEKREKFIRWRIQLLEKSVRKLDFTPKANGISTIVQVNDLNNSPGLFLPKWELRQATNLALQLLQDNYPELVAKQVFINVPWWYLAFYRFISAFLTQRTKSKFVFAGPSKSADTLFKYIAPELVPVQYGGLSREGEQEFTADDPATEATIKPATKHTVEFPVSETSHVVWEVRVVGWEVNYGAEFVPSAEEGYTVLVQKSRKIAPTDETIVSNSFKVGEAGKIVVTIDNQTSKKKKLLYRFKTKPVIVSE